MSEEVAFIGLGSMGGPIAGHLAGAGHNVTVYNRTSAKADAWVSEYGGTAAATLHEAAESARFVFSCVGGDDDLRSITMGEDGVFRAMQKDAVFVDHTTTSAEVAQQVAEEAQAGGFSFLDAPLAGGETGAQRGVLSIMVGGVAGGVRTSRAPDGNLRTKRSAHGRRWRRPIDEDGQSDLCHRDRRIAGRRIVICGESRSRRREGDRGDLERLGRLVADR